MNTTVRLSALSFLLVPTIASAYLGGFEAGDGYQGMFSSVITSQNIGTDWQDGSGFVPAALGYSAGPPITYFRAGPDVIRYNAGTYGANNGGPGGVGIDIADNSGLWKANSGGAIVNDASNGTNNLNFITAHGGTAHSGSNFLAIRAIDATLNYDYSIDSRDLNGVAPNSIQSATYSMDFWFCPGQVISPGGTSANIFGLSYVDSMNTTGLKFGYNGQGAVQYSLGSGGWVTSGVTVGINDWSHVTVTFDTAGDIASMDVAAWDDTSGSLFAPVSIFSGKSLGVDMNGFETLNWDLAGGMDKNFFDDVSFTTSNVVVPEPGSVLLVATTGVVVFFRRRRATR